ncbi:MAG: FKBP-type peptidyl-prolyl cis-trans isomerase [Crocinitomicaceae bacterium]|nr:FKBP-type peptidyl-prolyl cis-trans isomerase [Crocinitomicaceae bacterium]MBK8926029.1 FKBP-type peptidyl-prolyl cis-trans isomerase [Crocinitomicaceae bacterium]
MKKFLFFIHCLVLSLLFFACSGETDHTIITHDNQNKIEFEDYNQKVSYCIGLDHGFTALGIYGSPENKQKFDISQISSGMVDFLLGNPLRIPFESSDSIFENYLRPDGSVDESVVSKADASYAVGLEEGYVLVSSLVGRGIDQTIDVDLLVTGVQDGMLNRPPSVDLITARTEVANYYSNLNREDGEFFLAENASRDSVVVTESGLQYIVYKQGKGIKPNITDTCVVHYTGRFLDGREFESTIPSGIPAQFTPMGLVPGWQEGLLLMNEGAQYRLFMPYQLAYGEAGSGPIEPFSTLVFDVELIEVRKFR